MLAVVDGQPRLVNSTAAWTEWTLRETAKGWTIHGRLSEQKPEPRYLAVDAKGKISLVSEPGDGAYWKLTRKGAGHSFDTTIQASGGKFDGWYLGFSDAQEKIARNNRKHEWNRGGIIGEGRSQDQTVYFHRRSVILSDGCSHISAFRRCGAAAAYRRPLVLSVGFGIQDF